MRILIVVACLLFLMFLSAPVPAAEDGSTILDVSGIAAPAWQAGDEDLATRWAYLSGRYIFQRTCTGCHAWGPAHKTASKWGEYLSAFPDNHEPEVGKLYSDLTAQFDPGGYVPRDDQLRSALQVFLEKDALSAVASESERLEPYDGLPAVGEEAPDFTITDISGRKHTLSAYAGKKQVVVVFSRAHW